MEKERVRRLPDVPRAPDTDIARLAACIYEYDDLSALRPLVDALLDAGRPEDATELRRHIAGVCRSAVDGDAVNDWTRGLIRGHRFDISGSILKLFWFDLFDWEGSLAIVEKAIETENELKSRRAGMPQTYGSGVVFPSAGYAEVEYTAYAPGDPPGASGAAYTTSGGAITGTNVHNAHYRDLRTWLDSTEHQAETMMTASAPVEHTTDHSEMTTEQLATLMMESGLSIEQVVQLIQSQRFGEGADPTG